MSEAVRSPKPERENAAQLAEPAEPYVAELQATGLEPVVGDATVTEDSTQIYQSGMYASIGANDLINNPVAIRMLMNSLNEKARESERLKGRVESLQNELAANTPQPMSTVIFALISTAGTVLVGIGVNLVTTTYTVLDAQGATRQEVGGSMWVLVLGAFVTLAGTLGLTGLSRLFRRRKV